MTGNIEHPVCDETPFSQRFTSWETYFSSVLAFGCWFVYGSWSLDVPQSSNDWLAIISLFVFGGIMLLLLFPAIRFGNGRTQNC